MASVALGREGCWPSLAVFIGTDESSEKCTTVELEDVLAVVVGCVEVEANRRILLLPAAFSPGKVSDTEFWAGLEEVSAVI